MSPDGTSLAGAGTNLSEVYLWQLKTGRLVRSFRAAETPGSLGALIFNREGTLLAIGTDGGVKVFRLDGRPLCQIASQPGGPIGPVAFGDGASLWIYGPRGLQEWPCGGTKPARPAAAGRATAAVGRDHFGQLALARARG